MKTRSFFSAIALVLAAGTSHANLISNGGFEAGLTDWSCVTASDGGCFTGTQSAIGAVEGSSYFFGYDNEATGTLWQSFASAAGSVYSISLSFNTNGSVPPNALDLAVGDLSTSMALAEGSWTSFSSNFTASSALSTLTFGFKTVGGSGTVFIDNVVVEFVSSPVPEPTTLALCLVGLGALAIRGRGRNQG